jgi:hypothetical protein
MAGDSGAAFVTALLNGSTPGRWVLRGRSTRRYPTPPLDRIPEPLLRARSRPIGRPRRGYNAKRCSSSPSPKMLARSTRNDSQTSPCIIVQGRSVLLIRHRCSFGCRQTVPCSSANTLQVAPRAGSSRIDLIVLDLALLLQLPASTRRVSSRPSSPLSSSPTPAQGYPNLERRAASGHNSPAAPIVSIQIITAATKFGALCDDLRPGSRPRATGEPIIGTRARLGLRAT